MRHDVMSGVWQSLQPLCNDYAPEEIFALVSQMTYRYFLQMSFVDKWHANSACLMSRVLIARDCRVEIRLLPLVSTIHLIRDPEDNLLKTRQRPRAVPPCVRGLRKIRHGGKSASYISPWIRRGVAIRGIIIARNIPEGMRVAYDYSRHPLSRY